MAAQGITLTVTDEQVMAALARLDRAADDQSPIMAEIAGYLVTATKRHIERERGPDGPWPKLSPRTANRRVTARRRRGYENMLRVSNRLYSSITGESDARSARAGTNVPYAAAQQLGASIDMPEREQTIHLSTGKRRRFTRPGAKRSEARTVKVGAHTVRIPARPYLYLDAQDVAEIERIATEGLARQAGIEGGAP